MKTWKMVAGDFEINTQGRSRYIEDDEKVAQDLATVVLQNMNVIGQKRSGTAKNLEFLQTQIIRAVDRLINIQSSNSQTTERERITGIKRLEVIPSQHDPAAYYFFLEVSTAAGDSVTKVFDSEDWTDLSHLNWQGVLDNILAGNQTSF